MPTSAPPSPSLEELLGRANSLVNLAADPSGVPVSDLLLALGQLRGQLGTPHSDRIDAALVEMIRKLAKAIQSLESKMAELGVIVAELSAEPWHSAILLRALGQGAAGGSPARAEVLATGNRRTVVGIDRTRVNPADLAPGRKVYLNGKGSAVVLVESAESSPPVGEIASFERWLDPETKRRPVLKQRDEEIVVEAVCVPGAFDDLKSGDRIRFSRDAMIAFEKIVEPEAAAAGEFSPGRRSPVSRDELGGHGAAYARLETAVFGAMGDPARAARYGLQTRNVILLEGPPGTGKTLMARIVADEMERRFRRVCHFASVKPAEWEDPYVGVTQQKIRTFFANARKLAADGGLVVVYLDEIEAIGRHRGGMVSHHSDKALGALLAEIEGVEGDTNICLICASNRKDLLDPALTSRMGIEIRIGRPDAKSAREIFGIHFGASLSYSPNGSESPVTRNHLIDRAIALLYGNGEESDIARVRFADGKARIVKARELVSGRLIQQISEEARRHAFERDLKYDDLGLRLEDIETGVQAAVAKMRSSLTKVSVHSYLDDLPQDIAVVAVEPIAPKIRNPLRYRLTPGTPS